MLKRRYRYDPVMKSMVEVGLVDERPAPTVHIITDSAYEGLKATDGTRVDTRQRHRNYMKDHGLALYEDYKDSFEKAQEERDRDRMGVSGRDEDLGHELWESYEYLRAGNKPPPRPEVNREKSVVVDSYIVGKDI